MEIDNPPINNAPQEVNNANVQRVDDAQGEGGISHEANVPQETEQPPVVPNPAPQTDAVRQMSMVESLIQKLAMDPLTLTFMENVIRTIFVLYVRLACPAFRGNTDEECLSKVPDCIRLGLFDDLLWKLQRNEEAARAANNVPLLVNTVSPGMQLTEELLALVRDIPRDGRQETNPFRPRLPTPDEYSGPKSNNKIMTLKHLNRWIESVRASCRLSGLDESQSVLFAAQLLKGDALQWWGAWPMSESCTTMATLRDGLTARFVGSDPFGLLCQELESLSLANFSKYDSFKASFVQTVTAMKAYAPSPDRIWPDNVLIDKFLLSLKDTLYYEGVVLDASGQRPLTLDDAIVLCDARHDVLLNRGQALGEQKGSGPRESNKSDSRAKQDVQNKGRADKRKEQVASADKSSKRQKTASQSEKLTLHFMKKFGLSREVVEHRQQKVGKPAHFPCMKCGAIDGSHDHTACKKPVNYKKVVEEKSN